MAAVEAEQNSSKQQMLQQHKWKQLMHALILTLIENAFLSQAGERLDSRLTRCAQKVSVALPLVWNSFNAVS